jgi:hypothetical protein
MMAAEADKTAGHAAFLADAIRATAASVLFALGYPAAVDKNIIIQISKSSKGKMLRELKEN